MLCFTDYDINQHNPICDYIINQVIRPRAKVAGVELANHQRKLGLRERGKASRRAHKSAPAKHPLSTEGGTAASRVFTPSRPSAKARLRRAQGTQKEGTGPSPRSLRDDYVHGQLWDSARAKNHRGRHEFQPAVTLRVLRPSPSQFRNRAERPPHLIRNFRSHWLLFVVKIWGTWAQLRIIGPTIGILFFLVGRATQSDD